MFGLVIDQNEIMGSYRPKEGHFRAIRAAVVGWTNAISVTVTPKLGLKLDSRFPVFLPSCTAPVPVTGLFDAKLPNSPPSETFVPPSLLTTLTGFAFRLGVALVSIPHSCTFRHLVLENGTAFVVALCAASAARALEANGAERTSAHLCASTARVFDDDSGKLPSFFGVANRLPMAEPPSLRSPITMIVRLRLCILHFTGTLGTPFALLPYRSFHPLPDYTLGLVGMSNTAKVLPSSSSITMGLPGSENERAAALMKPTGMTAASQLQSAAIPYPFPPIP
ncbi:hypothetical protein C8F01DRAFT_1288761 [Mycena amicta]|nr:hypothetical protein C8F01DRAFT_1288761 [Mycena amicta]